MTTHPDLTADLTADLSNSNEAYGLAAKGYRHSSPIHEVLCVSPVVWRGRRIGEVAYAVDRGTWISRRDGRGDGYSAHATRELAIASARRSS